jgi:chromosome segregation ATPase
MDEAIQMVLGAVEKMNDKLDDLKEVVSESIAKDSSRLATLEQWKRSTEDVVPTLEERIRLLERERITQKAIDELQSKVEEQRKEIATLKEARVAITTRDKIWGAIVAILAGGVVDLIVHSLSKHP